MAKANDWNEVRRRVLKGDVLAFYSTHRWKVKREQVLRRDHYQCQRCLGRYRSDPERLPRLTRATTVHHDVPLRENFTLALVDDNLVSLCFKCHEEIEGRAGWKTEHNKEKLTEERW